MEDKVTLNPLTRWAMHKAPVVAGSAAALLTLAMNLLAIAFSSGKLAGFGLGLSEGYGLAALLLWSHIIWPAYRLAQLFGVPLHIESDVPSPGAVVFTTMVNALLLFLLVSCFSWFQARPRKPSDNR